MTVAIGGIEYFSILDTKDCKIEKYNVRVLGNLFDNFKVKIKGLEYNCHQNISVSYSFKLSRCKTLSDYSYVELGTRYKDYKYIILCHIDNKAYVGVLSKSSSKLRIVKFSAIEIREFISCGQFDVSILTCDFLDMLRSFRYNDILKPLQLSHSLVSDDILHRTLAKIKILGMTNTDCMLSNINFSCYTSSNGLPLLDSSTFKIPLVKSILVTNCNLTSAQISESKIINLKDNIFNFNDYIKLAIKLRESYMEYLKNFYCIVNIKPELSLVTLVNTGKETIADGLILGNYLTASLNQKYISSLPSEKLC